MESWLTGVLLVLWCLSIAMYIAVRDRMRKVQPEIHDEIFGKYLVEHSAEKSMNFLRLSLFSTCWRRFSDDRLLLLLKINRAVSVTFILMIIGAITYVIIAGSIDVFYS